MAEPVTGQFVSERTIEPLPLLSVIIPAHNEAAKIGQAVAAVRRYAMERVRPVELIVVDDGSSDETARIAAQAPADPITVKVLRNERNQGKGHSVRRGMMEARGELRLFCDADMSTPIEQLDELLPWAARGFDVIIGSRKLSESLLRPPQRAVRRLMGNLFRLIRGLLMLRSIRDTQCGFKLFTAAAATAVFPLQEETGPAFDCEILARAQISGFAIREVGVLWRNNPDSRMRPLRDGTRMLMSLLRIRWNMRRWETRVPHTPHHDLEK